jgi:hypothetical protein
LTLRLVVAALRIKKERGYGPDVNHHRSHKYCMFRRAGQGTTLQSLKGHRLSRDGIRAVGCSSEGKHSDLKALQSWDDHGMILKWTTE